MSLYPCCRASSISFAISSGLGTCRRWRRSFANSRRSGVGALGMLLIHVQLHLGLADVEVSLLAENPLHERAPVLVRVRDQVGDLRVELWSQPSLHAAQHVLVVLPPLFRRAGIDPLERQEPLPGEMAQGRLRFRSWHRSPPVPARRPRPSARGLSRTSPAAGLSSACRGPRPAPAAR